MTVATIEVRLDEREAVMGEQTMVERAAAAIPDYYIIGSTNPIEWRIVEPSDYPVGNFIAGPFATENAAEAEMKRIYARAAIEAMRNPTERMLKAEMDLGGYGYGDDVYSADPAAAAPALIRKIAAQDKALEDIAALDPTNMTLGDCIFAVTIARAAINARVFRKGGK